MEKEIIDLVHQYRDSKIMNKIEIEKRIKELVAILQFLLHFFYVPIVYAFLLLY